MADVGTLVDTYGLYIGGRWVEPDDGRYDDVSPSTEAVIATAPDASAGQVATAIATAREAFDEGPWGSATAAERAGCLNELGNALLEHADEFFALSQSPWARYRVLRGADDPR
jgi:aldehyde dehydrogenase (NAD+)